MPRTSPSRTLHNAPALGYVAAAPALLAILLLIAAGAQGTRPTRDARRLLGDNPLYEGCYLDRPCREDPAPPGKKFALGWVGQDISENEKTMTRYKCSVLAHARGYKYAAIQYGFLCFGSNDISKQTKADNSSCPTPCMRGIQDEMCGGACYNSVYRIADAIKAKYTARTDGKTEADDLRRDDVPQVCLEGQYITSWEIGFSGETPPRLVRVQGVCSKNDPLIAAKGTVEPATTVKGLPRLSSPDGFTCDMLQKDGATEIGSYIAMSRFLGQGASPGSSTKPWTICTDIPEDWIAIGYQRVAGHVLDGMSFLMAPMEMVKGSVSPAASPELPPSSSPASPGQPGVAPPINTTSKSSADKSARDMKIGLAVGISGGLGIVAAVLLIIHRTHMVAKLCGGKNADKPAGGAAKPTP